MTDIKKERKVKDFSKGMIYRIVCNITGDVYIGSSVQTCAQRLSQHKSKYKIWLDNNKEYITVFKIIAKDDYKIVLVETYPCKNNDELHSREQHWIEQTECVNKIRAHTTEEQLKCFNTQWSKTWYENNKEYVKECGNKYRQKNSERISERNKQVITCECGKEITQSSKTRHNKSQQHINFTQA